MSGIELLLEELCSELGFCLPEEARARLATAPVEDVEAFTDAVFAAEGMDSVLVEKRLRREVYDCVSRHLKGRASARD